MKTIAAVALATMCAACAFGVDRVKLPASQAVAAPDHGPAMRVSVKDARGDLSGAKVGFKRNGYGAKTGSVELADGEPLSARLERDLVSVLRERGYRAVGESEASSGDLHCDAEILSFVVDVKQGFWSGALEGIGTVRVEILDAASGRQVWRDIVRADHTKSGLQFVSGTDHQQVVERTYAALIENLRSAIPDSHGPSAKPASAP